MDADGETMATTRTREEIDKDAEENRKEALLASTESLQPNFNRSSVTEKQISKLQELHKRRMQIKASSKIHKKSKGSKNSQSRAIKDGESSKKLKESTSSTTTLERHHHKTVPMIPQKLYWGLDTKERWERKANM
ncbi:hypothetical protein EUTSA_v10014997mg [Eutrema salsugineum]|uniref:Uncharacterized protein n=1 Tax=Eutrema salsugineum TaxID=72664 RepID=V4KUH6_EUTSA|nr:uncharacterized protein LOC18017374 [Eutrema salsugineum]ESQ41600.1 hypothetical protein EUTSA_v10014997mg [Eutrema salsugineum]